MRRFPDFVLSQSDLEAVLLQEAIVFTCSSFSASVLLIPPFSTIIQKVVLYKLLIWPEHRIS
jgi:hypothetical protein